MEGMVEVQGLQGLVGQEVLGVLEVLEVQMILKVLVHPGNQLVLVHLVYLLVHRLEGRLVVVVLVLLG